MLPSERMDPSPVRPGPRVFLHRPPYYLRNDRGPRAFEPVGCTLVDNPEDADWTVLGLYGDVPEFAGRTPNILVITDEPRHAIGAPRLRSYRGSMVHAFDLSIGRFPDFWEGYLHFQPMPLLDPATPRSASVMLATKQGWMIGTHAADLIGARARLAHYGVTHGLLDLYGKGWEPLPTQGESRLGDGNRGWEDVKREILGQYRFNFALENTYIPGYVSEKFWQALEGGCLPVYLGSPWFDRVIDPDLYVDLRRHDSPDEVFRYLEALPEAERVERTAALQARLTALRAEVDPGAWARWARETAQLVVDLDAQDGFTRTTWGRSNRSVWTGWESFPEDKVPAPPARVGLLRRVARRIRRRLRR